MNQPQAHARILSYGSGPTRAVAADGPTRPHPSAAAPHVRVARVLLAWVLAGVLPSAASWGADEAHLLDLVGADAGAIVEVTGVRERLAEREQIEWWQRLKRSQLYADWKRSSEFRKVQQARGVLEAVVGKPLDVFAGELFGEQVVVAVYPVSAEQEYGVLLTRAVSREVLDEAIESWQRADPVPTVSVDYAGERYFRRMRPGRRGKPSETVFYAVLGRTFAFSDNETGIRRVIDLWARTLTGADSEDASQQLSTMRQSRAFREARAALTGDPMVVCYVNPRRWDDRFPPAEAIPEEDRWIRYAWEQIESLIVGVRIEDGPVAEFVAHYDPAGVSDAWSAFVRRASRDDDLLAGVPADALAVVAGRFEPSLLEPFVEAVIPKEDRPRWENLRASLRGVLLGLDPFDDVLSQLDGRLTAFAVPLDQPSRRPSADFPPLDACLTFSWRSSASGAESAAGEQARRAVDNAAATVLHGMAAVAGQTPPRVRTESFPTGTLRWMEGLPPIEPAVIVDQRVLGLATSPQVLQSVLETGRDKGLAARPDVAEWRNRYFPQASHLAFFDVVGIRAWIARHRDFLAGGRPEAERRAKPIDRLLDVLSLADGAFWAVSVESERLRLVVGGVTRTNGASGR